MAASLSTFFYNLLKKQGGGFFSAFPSKQKAQFAGLALDQSLNGLIGAGSGTSLPVLKGASSVPYAAGTYFFLLPAGILYVTDGTVWYPAVPAGSSYGTVQSTGSAQGVANNGLITFQNGVATLSGAMAYAGGVWTVPVAGLYLVGYGAVLTGLTAGQTYLFINTGVASGSLYGGICGIVATAGQTTLAGSGVALISLAGGASVGVEYQGAGNATVTGGDANSFIVRVA